MKSEMDALSMDERQRHAWLLANRVTLMIVGLIWIGMIVYEFSRDKTPLFLIIMVPAFALVRFLSYFVYARKLT